MIPFSNIEPPNGPLIGSIAASTEGEQDRIENFSGISLDAPLSRETVDLGEGEHSLPSNACEP
jgi:hypothetical protein